MDVSIGKVLLAESRLVVVGTVKVLRPDSGLMVVGTVKVLHPESARVGLGFSLCCCFSFVIINVVSHMKVSSVSLFVFCYDVLWSTLHYLN